MMMGSVPPQMMRQQQQQQVPGFAYQQQGPGVAYQQQGPGVTYQQQGPGVAYQQQGLGFAYQQQGPGAAYQQQGPGVAVQGTAPNSEVTFFKRRDVVEDFIKWGPLGMFLTFLLTLILTAFLSIRASGGSPCEPMPVCDISVYGGSPPGGPSTVMFKAGFTLLVLQSLPVIWARFLQTLNGIAALCFVAATIALLIMAYVPFYSSPVHFEAAIAAFGLLGIGQLVDSCGSCWAISLPGAGCCSCIQWVRRGMVVTYLSLFGAWFYFEEFEGVSYPAFEYLASLGPFLVFITWSIEMCGGTPGQAPEYLYNNVA